MQNTILTLNVLYFTLLFKFSFFLSLGLLGYSSSLRRKNILVIAGGFHGSVSGDVLAYTLPNALSMKRNDKVCSLYGSQIRLVAGSRRKLLHRRANGTGGRSRGGTFCFEWGFMRTFPGNQDVAVK